MDAGAIERLLAEHGGGLRALAGALVRDDHLAEDVAQETWLRLLQRPPRGVRSLGAWLRRVTGNLAHNTARERRRRADRESAQPRGEACPAADVAARAEVLRAVAEAVHALPAPYREAVILRFFHGLPARTIAARLDVPLATVRSRLQRALDLLRRSLVPRLGDDTWRGALGAALGMKTVAGRRIGVAAAGTIGGGIVMKKVLSGVFVVLLVGLVWWGGTSWGTGVPLGGAEAPPPSRPAVGSLEAREPEGGPAAPEPVAAARAPVAVESGSLVVRVRALSGKSASSGGPAEEGLPLQGALLRIWPGTVPVAPFDDTPLEVRSDEEGEVRLTGLDPGPWQVLAAFDREARARSVVVEPGSEARVDIVRPAAGIVRGRVVDEAGAPVADAEVWVMRGTSLSVLGRDGLGVRPPVCLRAGARSDGRGRFRMAWIAEEDLIGARKAGYVPSYSRGLSDRVQGGFTIVLRSGTATVTGTVRDHAGEPVRGAVVVVHPAGQDTRRTRDGNLLRQRLPEFVRTGPDGRFRFADLPPGRQRLEAERPVAGSGLGGRAEVAVVSGGHADVDLVFEAIAAVRGKVCYVDGTPVVGARVQVNPDAQTDGHYSDNRTRRDGSYCLTYAPADRPYVVTVQFGRQRLAIVEVPDPEPGWIRRDFVLEDVAPLRGRVVGPDGEGLPDWWVRVKEQETGDHLGVARTDEHGAFTEHCLPVGNLRVQALPRGGDRQRPVVEREGVRAGGGELTLTVPGGAIPRGSLRGVLTDTGGRPLAGAEVVLWRADDRRYSSDRTTETTPEGAFAFAGVPSGTFVLEGAPRGFPRRELARCTLDAGENADLAAVTLPLPAHLHVEIRRPGGGEWPGAMPWIVVRDAEEELVETRAELVDGTWHIAVPCPAEGTARFQVRPVGTDLIAEPREVELGSGARRSLRFSVAIGRDRVLWFNREGRKELKDEMPLHIEIRDPQGRLVLDRDRLSIWYVGGYHRWFLRHTLPFGRYRITARSEDGTRYATTFEVTDALDQPTRIDVPVVE